MSLKLSHSACAKYQQCPQAYRYHYYDRIRSNVTSAALMFGSALDAGINALIAESEHVEQKFIDAFTYQELNGVNTYLIDSPNLVYADADFDSELLPSDEGLERYQEIRSKKKAIGFQLLTKEEKVFYNKMNWDSLCAKGILMLKAYEKEVLPKFNKVLGVQEQINLSNDNGDTVVGYVDLVVDHKDHGIVIFDNKTASRPYDEDAVLTSPQLSLYVHALESKYNTRKAGYIVLNKNVMKNRQKVCKTCGHDGTGSRAKTCDKTVMEKRCGGEWAEAISPSISIQTIVDEIPIQTEKIVIENYDTVCNSIASGSFPRNLNTCTNVYGGKCAYFDLCYKDSMKGLVVKE